MKETTKLCQSILLNNKGYIKTSCDSIFSTKKMKTQSVLNSFPLVESIFPTLLALNTNSPEVKFVKVESMYKDLPGVYDFTFKKTDNQSICWNIYNCTEHYKGVHESQQRINSSKMFQEISKESEKNKTIHFSNLF